MKSQKTEYLRNKFQKNIIRNIFFLLQSPRALPQIAIPSVFIPLFQINADHRTGWIIYGVAAGGASVPAELMWVTSQAERFS